MSTELNLFVPTIAQSLESGALSSAIHPNLYRLLSRATLTSRIGGSLESTLAAFFSIPPERVNSVANLCAALDGVDSISTPYFRMDPVHFNVDPHQILLFTGPTMVPTGAEADALLALLNDNIKGFNICRGASPARWYAPLNGEFATTSISAARGRAIGPLMPQGDDAMRAHQLMNEVQMLFHECEVNRGREGRGVPTITGVWIWGNEALNTSANQGVELVVGDDVLGLALAQAAGLESSVELSPQETIERAANQRVLAVLGAPNGATTKAHSSDISLDELERDWAEPLSKALSAGKIGRLNFVCENWYYTVSRWDMKKIWRHFSLPIDG